MPASFSYLSFSQAKLWALCYRAAGYSVDELIELVPNRTKGGTGIEPQTFRAWKLDPAFKDAWEQTEADPSWCQRNIIAPWLLTKSLVKDLEYLSSKDSKGFSPKKMELLMTQLGLINQVDQTGAARFQNLIEMATLKLPPRPQITVVDVTTDYETQE